MSKYDLSIDFDKTSYYPDEVLEGVITLTVNEPITCNKLSVRFEMFVTGSGRGLTRSAGEGQLFTGQLQPGVYRYPFTFHPPCGPFSFRGNLFSVGWRVRAVADVAWALDLKVSKEFELKPSPGMNGRALYSYGPTYSSRPTTPIEDNVLSSFLAKKKLNPPKVILSGRVLCHGEELEVELLFSTKKKLSFDSAFAVLRSSEFAILGDSIGSWSRQEIKAEFVSEEHSPAPLDIYREAPAQLLPIQLVKAREEYRLRATLRISNSVPTTFVAPYYEVRTELIVTLGIVGWPDWCATFLLTIHPGHC